jgi:hypothetical protein
MQRQILFSIALLAGLFVAGGLCGLAARMLGGGLTEEHAQLERCVLASRHSHPNEDARSALAHLDVEVPTCMNGAGYQVALDAQNCSRALWQGDLFCYEPKGTLGKLIHRVDASWLIHVHGAAVRQTMSGA